MCLLRYLHTPLQSIYLNGTGAAKPGDVWYDYITNELYGAAMATDIVNASSATALNSYSQNIVTDGLVLYLDARKKESYPGTGRIWYDLSPSGLNLTGVRDTGISSIDGVNSLGGAWTSASTSIVVIISI